jgi:hypothetical protein
LDFGPARDREQGLGAKGVLGRDGCRQEAFGIKTREKVLACHAGEQFNRMKAAVTHGRHARERRHRISMD